MSILYKKADLYETILSFEYVSCCFVSTAHSDYFALAQNRAMQRMKDQLWIGWTKSLQGFQQTHPSVQKQTCRMKEIWTWTCRLPPKLERLEPASVMLKTGRARAQLLALISTLSCLIVGFVWCFFPKIRFTFSFQERSKNTQFSRWTAMNFFSGGFCNPPSGAPGFVFGFLPAGHPGDLRFFKRGTARGGNGFAFLSSGGSQIRCSFLGDDRHLVPETSTLQLAGYQLDDEPQIITNETWDSNHH